ncbi:hypothetical protein Pla52o_11940 [Novipirellula galeiformis]|uniref:Uncharacterized protein n=1 Tax=Novipirellula galeiformis TaxID=2528004 RepID=A0A5C6CKB4_9BACT|nr:hypothetical protein Pla52o_11940 [Novipirellula galeiformis]
MAKNQKTGCDIVSIPSEQTLRSKLRVIVAEAKRLELLISTARELERIELEATTPESTEVPRG